MYMYIIYVCIVYEDSSLVYVHVKPPSIYSTHIYLYHHSSQDARNTKRYIEQLIDSHFIDCFTSVKGSILLYMYMTRMSMMRDRDTEFETW